MTPIYGIALWIVVGAIAGWSATILARTHSDRAGRVRSMIIGVMGALAAGLLARDGMMTRGFFGGDAEHAGVLGHVFVALMGSGVLLGIVHLFSRGNRSVPEQQ